MALLPNYSETLILPIAASQVEAAIRAVTMQQDLIYDDVEKAAYTFNGKVDINGFQISLILNYPDNYLPMVVGRLEPTSVGCILFLKYQLFFSSRAFLFFWTFVTMLIALFFYFFQQHTLYAFLSFTVGMGNYWFAFLAFQKRVKATKTQLYKVLYLLPDH